MRAWLAARKRREAPDHGALHELAGPSSPRAGEAPGMEADAVCLVAIAPPPQPLAHAAAPRGGGAALAAKLRAGGAGLLARASAVAAAAAAPPPPPRGPRSTTTLAQLPAAAFDAIWCHLADADRRAARLACRGLFDAAVRRAALRPADLPAAADLASRLPELSELRLQLQAGGEAASDLDLVHLQGWARAVAGTLPRLRGLEVEGRVRGGALAAVARLAAGAGPGLQQLRLRGLRLAGAPRRSSDAGDGRRASSSGDGRARRESGSGGRRTSSSGRDDEERPRAPLRSCRPAAGRCAAHGTFSCGSSGSDSTTTEAREERFLCGMLEALPGLRELDLGCSSAPGGGWCTSTAPLPLSALRCVAQLSELRALGVDATSVRDGRCAAAVIEGLPLLERLTLRASCPQGPRAAGGGPVLAAALCRLTRLEQLELESHDAGADFGAALRLGRLQRLHSLALGLCPGLPPSVACQVGGRAALDHGAPPLPAVCCCAALGRTLHSTLPLFTQPRH
jgi:hypothetical protein